MLYVSIILSVWFVAWLAYSIYMREVGKQLYMWIEDMYEDEDDEDMDALLEKSKKGVTHLSCKECNYMWWSIGPNPNYCPNCGKKRN